MGYGSCGYAPPNSANACFEAFDSGADAFAVDVCETGDGVVVVGNRRTLRVLVPRFEGVPTWPAVKDADLGAVFGGGRARHRVVCVRDFLEAMGPLSLHLVVDGSLTRRASAVLEEAVRLRVVGETTVVAVPEWLEHARLPNHVPRVALLRGGEHSSDCISIRADALAAPARSLPTLGRLRIAKIALRCDTRPALVAAQITGAFAVHTERPAWFRCAWGEAAPPRFRRAPFG